jgi:hypothetical protein
MNKMSPATDKGWRSSLGVERGAKNTLQYKQHEKKFYPRAVINTFILSHTMRLIWTSGGFCQYLENQDICGFHGYHVAKVTITFVYEWCHNVIINGYGRV